MCKTDEILTKSSISVRRQFKIGLYSVSVIEDKYKKSIIEERASFQIPINCATPTDIQWQQKSEICQEILTTFLHSPQIALKLISQILLAIEILFVKKDNDKKTIRHG